MYSTEQQEFWKGEFGRSYTDRNTREHEAWNDFYRNLYGKTKMQLNAEFIGHLPLNSPILEVGCNTRAAVGGTTATRLYKPLWCRIAMVCG